MDDLISRKATYDKIDKYFGDLPIVVHHDMLQIIKDMPSAQQNECCAEMEGREDEKRRYSVCRCCRNFRT